MNVSSKIKMLSLYLLTLRLIARIIYKLKDKFNYPFNKLWRLIYILLPKNNVYLTTITNHKIKILPKDHQQTLYSTGKSGFQISDFIKNINYPFVFIDIGANHGIYTLDAHKNPFLISSHSIEPNPESFHHLTDNIKYNSNKPAHFYNVAIGRSNEKVTLTVHPWHSGLSNLARRGGERKIFVKSRDHSLFDLIYKKNQNCFYVIKCDTEGLEPLIIKNLLNSKISKFISSLMIEITPEWLNLEDEKMLISNIASLGFKSMDIKEIIKGKKQKDIILKREIFLNQFCN